MQNVRNLEGTKCKPAKTNIKGRNSKFSKLIYKIQNNRNLGDPCLTPQIQRQKQMKKDRNSKFSKLIYGIQNDTNHGGSLCNPTNAKSKADIIRQNTKFLK